MAETMNSRLPIWPWVNFRELFLKDRPSFFAPFPMLSLIGFFIGVDFEKNLTIKIRSIYHIHKLI